MGAETLHDQVVESVAVRVAVKGAAVGESEPALPVVSVGAEDQLPHFCRSIPTDGPEQRDGTVRLLAIAVTVGGDSEDPKVPPVPRRASGLGSAFWSGVSHIEALGLTEMRVVADETQPDGSRQAATQVVLTGGGRGHVRDRVGDASQLAQSNEMQREFSSAAAGLLLGDENVNLRILAVADVVDEGDLGPHEIKIAEVAVEKDAKSGGPCGCITGCGQGCGLLCLDGNGRSKQREHESDG